jgi:hypothetical protein
VEEQRGGAERCRPVCAFRKVIGVSPPARRALDGRVGRGVRFRVVPDGVTTSIAWMDSKFTSVDRHS